MPVLCADSSVEIVHGIPMTVKSSITCPNCFNYRTPILTGKHGFQSTDLGHELSKSVLSLLVCLAHPEDLSPELHGSLVSPSYVPLQTHDHAIDP